MSHFFLLGKIFAINIIESEDNSVESVRTHGHIHELGLGQHSH